MAAGCPQPSQSQYNNIEQSEDCLTLDIYMPIVSFINFFIVPVITLNSVWKWIKSKWFILLDTWRIIHYGNFIGVLWIHPSRTQKYRCFNQLSSRTSWLVPLLWRRKGYQKFNLSAVLFHILSSWDCWSYHWYPKQAEEKTVGGNYGLNDQLQALTFINQNKENINYNRLTIRLEISTKTDILVTLMLVTDVGDQMFWWQVWDVGDRFDTLKK